MKTAEEWFNKYKVNADKYLSMSAIEAIQLDAMKEGMRRAAEIAKQESDKVCYEDPYAHHAIIAKMDKLTEKDLQ